VASAIDTVSGLAMIRALIDGERRGAVLADLARGRMRAKIADLSLALEGRFGEHHALMCTLHLEHIAGLHEMIARLGAQAEKMMTPCAAQQDLAIIAVARTLILIIWHVLTEGVPHADLGADFYARRSTPSRKPAA